MKRSRDDRGEKRSKNKNLGHPLYQAILHNPLDQLAISAWLDHLEENNQPVKQARSGLVSRRYDNDLGIRKDTKQGVVFRVYFYGLDYFTDKTVRYLFKNYPLVEVDISDRYPVYDSSTHTFNWLTVPHVGNPSFLPIHIFSRLNRTSYPSDDRAHNSAVINLSAACVSYGRWLVGLPALDFRLLEEQRWNSLQKRYKYES